MRCAAIVGEREVGGELLEIVVMQGKGFVLSVLKEADGQNGSREALSEERHTWA